LSYARAGELLLEKVPIDAPLAPDVERFAESKDGRDPDGSVRVDAEPAELAVDAVRIRQVVQNLLRNATQASTPDAEVSVRDGAKPGRLSRDRDRPWGRRSEALRGRVFEPFFTEAVRWQRPGPGRVQERIGKRTAGRSKCAAPKSAVPRSA
jgi:signal transduction histidine kinase